MSAPALLTSDELGRALGYADRAAVHYRLARGDVRLAGLPPRGVLAPVFRGVAERLIDCANRQRTREAAIATRSTAADWMLAAERATP